MSPYLPGTVELLPTLGALFPRGKPVQSEASRPYLPDTVELFPTPGALSTRGGPVQDACHGGCEFPANSGLSGWMHIRGFSECMYFVRLIRLHP